MKSEKQNPTYRYKQGFNEKQNRLYSNTSASQCKRIVQIFEAEGKQQNTFSFRRKGIMHPAGRIKDLRDSGYKILTSYVKEPDTNGVLHRIASYVYVGYKEVR